MNKQHHLGEIRPHPGQTVFEIKSELVTKVADYMQKGLLDHMHGKAFYNLAVLYIVPADIQTMKVVHHDNPIPEGHVRVGAVESVTHKKKIVWNDGCTYVVALNKKNALKKYLKTQL